MLDSFGDGFMVFDFNWRITHCNLIAAAHYGLKRDDLVGKVAWDVGGLGPDRALRRFLERAAEARASIDAEVSSELQSGRWFYLRAFPLEGGLGLSSRDVTERHDLSRREREQSERLELALATAGFGDWRWDAATDMVDFSPRAAEMAGFVPGATLTWTLMLDYLHPDDRERARHAVIKAITDHTLYDIEYRFTRPSDGAERWMMIRARGQYADDGQAIGMLGVLTDITERKEFEARIRADRARLAESEARFRAMADSAPSPVWVTAAKGGIEFANRAFSDLTGLSQDELQGDTWMALVHPDDRARAALIRDPSRRGEPIRPWDMRVRVANGEWRWWRTVSQARLDEAGEFQGYVGLAMDITEAHRAEERQRLLINELNHRVKNTLATIQSLARQTLREGVAVGEARERLTDRLLALSAAHNVLTKDNWESADLGAIAREAVQPYDDPAGARIEVCGPPTRLAPQVALALSMALHELATNAVKYGALSAPEGRVRLTWALEPAGDAVRIDWRETGGPPVSPPATKGFGSRLLASLAGELGEPARIDYAPEGLCCGLRAPIA